MGCKINFTSEPIQNKFPHQSNFNKVQLSALYKMINELIEERVIEETSFIEGDYMNSVFLVPKKDSTPEDPKFRLILNMKTLNKNFVKLTHHKIHSLSTCLDLMEKDCYMGSVDLKSAFHSIPMDPSYTKYLKF